MRHSVRWDLSLPAPQRLVDEVSRDLARVFADARYNVLSDLGIFASHGLVGDGLTAKRGREIGNLVEKNRKKVDKDGRSQ